MNNGDGGWSHCASWHSDIIHSSWHPSWIPRIVLPSALVSWRPSDGLMMDVYKSFRKHNNPVDRWTVPTSGLKCSINSKYFWIENSWCTGRDLWLHHYVSTINSFVLLSGEGGYGYKIGWNLVIRSRKSENSRWVLESPLYSAFLGWELCVKCW